MKEAPNSSGLRQTFSLRPGLNVNAADFKPSETTENRFQSTSPVLRFYFHIAGSGYWELQSPHGRTAENRITHCDRFSTALFYPELEGKMHLPAECRQFHLSIHISPTLLNSYLGDDCENFPEELRAISEGCERRDFAHSGPLSQIMDAAVHQLLHSPYTGAMKRLYMESKAIELIAHKLAQIVSPNSSAQTPLKLRSDDIDRIRYAEEILCRDLERPPKLFDLARTVGTNHCDLNKGFREVFGVTVFGHLRQMRLINAKRLLEEEGMNVTEAALTVGYNSMSSFSRAFSEFFGQSPATCSKKRR
jgi:AraC family transcriptional regulator, transcriptional activator of the genes for pyochelin and ferripyochelin receptors